MMPGTSMAWRMALRTLISDSAGSWTFIAIHS